MKLNQLRLKANEKGFTLIELMIVIAIIGILAAIAIPNFISYRDKAFCTSAEKDAASLQGAIADYFAIPSNRSYNATGTMYGNGTAVIGFPGTQTIRLSGANTGAIVPVVNANQFRIRVTDASGRCPAGYRQVPNTKWSLTTPAAADFTYRLTM